MDSGSSVNQLLPSPVQDIDVDEIASPVIASAATTGGSLASTTRQQMQQLLANTPDAPPAPVSRVVRFAQVRSQHGSMELVKQQPPARDQPVQATETVFGLDSHAQPETRVTATPSPGGGYGTFGGREMSMSSSGNRSQDKIKVCCTECLCVCVCECVCG